MGRQNQAENEDRLHENQRRLHRQALARREYMADTPYPEEQTINELLQLLNGQEHCLQPEPGGEKSGRPNSKKRRQKHDAGNRLKAVAKRELMHLYIREGCGGKWQGTLKALRKALNRDKRFDRSEASLFRDLNGTKLWEPPDRKAPHKTLPRKGEREAVSRDAGPDDLSDHGAWTMP